MSTVINEPIDVGAVFGKTRIKPKWFVWNGKKRDIKEVTYTWHTREGEAEVIHFSVTDGATVFELTFNQKTLRWTLENTDTD